jgi:hypothetical protein
LLSEIANHCRKERVIDEIQFGDGTFFKKASVGLSLVDVVTARGAFDAG